MKIEIFGFAPEVYNCNPCNNAKRLCDQKGWDYEFISMADSVSERGKPVINQALATELKSRLPGVPMLGMTMPQIFVDSQHIGGFDEFRAFAQK